MSLFYFFTVPSAGETPTWVWITILSISLSFIGIIFWFWGCYLWVKLKNRHWAFTFLGFLSLIGILIISSLDDRSDKAIKERKTDKRIKKIPSQIQSDLIAEHLEPRYCEKCGSPLIIRKFIQSGFDKDTGYPKYNVIIACPNAIIYETDVLPKTKITWKGRFGGHTVDKVSVIVHPEDRKKQEH